MSKHVKNNAGEPEAMWSGDSLAVAMGKFDRNKYYIMLCTSLNTVGKSIINKASDPLIYWVSYYKN